MDQKQEKLKTPSRTETSTLRTKSEPTHPAMPASRKAGQHYTPKWYSLLMTRGWNTPMHRKVARPSMMP